MATLKFKSGEEIQIPDNFIEADIIPEETIPESIKTHKGTYYQIVFPQVTIKPAEEMLEYLNYFKEGGEPISFSKFIVLKYYTPRPLEM